MGVEIGTIIHLEANYPFQKYTKKKVLPNIFVLLHV